MVKDKGNNHPSDIYSMLFKQLNIVTVGIRIDFVI